MPENKKGQQKVEKKAEGPKEIPAFKDEEGKLVKLSAKNFPKTKEGRMAFCDYQVLRWTAKKDRISKAGDPKQKKLAKIEKMKAMIAKLEKELGGDDSE